MRFHTLYANGMTGETRENAVFAKVQLEKGTGKACSLFLCAKFLES